MGDKVRWFGFYNPDEGRKRALERVGQSTMQIPVDPQDLRPAPDAVARYFGGVGYKLSPKALEQVQAGIEQAETLISPVAGYRVISAGSIKAGIDCERITEDDSGLPFGFSEFSTGYFAVYLATLGGVLEESCRELSNQNKMYQALLLDAVGTAMLDIMGKRIETAVDAHARRMGLYAGCRRGPGLNGVAVETQALLFNLLDGDTLGVHLNESFVMCPSKSISAFVIFDESEQKLRPGDKCSQCQMKQCQFRIRLSETQDADPVIH